MTICASPVRLRLILDSLLAFYTSDSIPRLLVSLWSKLVHRFRETSLGKKENGDDVVILDHTLLIIVRMDFLRTNCGISALIPKVSQMVTSIAAQVRPEDQKSGLLTGCPTVPQ